jgi:hypothetical protein
MLKFLIVKGRIFSPLVALDFPMAELKGQNTVMSRTGIITSYLKLR